MESKTRASRPPGPSVSTMAGTLPFGLIGSEGGRVLFALAGVDGDHLVGKSRLLEKEGDLRGFGVGWK